MNSSISSHIIPKRVESVVYLMVIGLTAHFLLQRVYRQNTPPEYAAEFTGEGTADDD